jgi:YT521-B-like domain
MANSYSYIGLYVPWYSPQFCKGVWYHPFYPVPTLSEPEASTPKDLLRPMTPIQALDTKKMPHITSSELKLLNTNTNSFIQKNKGKFFIMLAQCEDDIHKSLKYGIWTSGYEGNWKLNSAFSSSVNIEPVYLFFSVIGSDMFVGVAEMISNVNFSASFNGWYPDYSNLGYFRVRWVLVKDIPFNKIEFIKLPKGKPINTAIDTQEIPRQVAYKLLKVFNEARTFKSLLEDFEYYNRKEEIVLSSLV